jgi:hypothetical protein
MALGLISTVRPFLYAVILFSLEFAKGVPVMSRERL